MVTDKYIKGFREGFGIVASTSVLIIAGLAASNHVLLVGMVAIGISLLIDVESDGYVNAD